MDETEGLPHTVTLMTTNRCTAFCRSCGVNANPAGTKRLSLRSMRRYIDQAAELGVRLIVFSGGEPTLLGDELDDAVRHADSLGLLTRIVSNAYWALSKAVTLGRLAELKQAGLCEVNFSTGDYHQQFVPVQNVINGALAATELGMTCVVMVEIHRDSSYNRESFLAESEVSAILESAEAKGRLLVLESPWVDMSRDASQNLGNLRLLSRENLGYRNGCSSIIGGVAIDPDESFGACCGITRNKIPELTVGSLRHSTMAELIELMKRDLMKRWLFTQGPEHILAWVSEYDPGIKWEGKYAHQCHACHEVYTNPTVKAVLTKHYNKKLLDINFQYWMMRRHIKPKLSARDRCRYGKSCSA